MDQLLTEKEISTFLKKLGVRNWSEANESLFREIFQKYIFHPDYAYENIIMACTDPKYRKAPSPFEAINQILQTQRGLCVNHNFFLMNLFQKIGFDAFLVASTINNARKIPSKIQAPSHPLCIVKIPRSGTWLVDFGLGNAFHDPICLDALPYRFNVGGFMIEYRKIIRSSDSKEIYQRVHHIADTAKGRFETPEEVRYFFTLEKASFEDFYPATKLLYADPTVSFFLNHAFTFRYIDRINSIDFKAILFLRKSYVLFSANEILERNEFNSYREMIPTFCKFFPMIPIEHIEKAFSIFDQSEVRI